MDAEAQLVQAILFDRGELTRLQRERLLHGLARAAGDRFGVALHGQMLRILSGRAPTPPRERVLLDFARHIRVEGRPSAGTGPLQAEGWATGAVFDAVLTAGLSAFLGELAVGLQTKPDFAVSEEVPGNDDPGPAHGTLEAASEPPFPVPEAPPAAPPDGYPPFALLKREMGFVPRLFAAQMARPAVVEAQVALLAAVLFARGSLPRIHKERILAEVAEQRANIYLAAQQDRVLAMLGDRRGAEPDAPLTGQERVEATVVAALGQMLCTLQLGLGVPPDFALTREFRPSKKANLPAPAFRQRSSEAAQDPDLETVRQVQQGNADAFESLIERHGQRVYRVLAGILADPEEARDAMQDTFLKAYQHVGAFEGRARFSTWLICIATNTALQRLRERRPAESLDEGGEEDFRPRQVQSWVDNPEQVYSKAQIKMLVESGVRRLPAKYRTVLVLRDIQQLSTEEAAEALGLGVPALKSRLLRARLMLREALAPHFSSGAEGAHSS